MSTIIKIGHASMSESGTAIGVAGDSTGKEVYIVSKYTAANLSPYVVLRPTTPELASRSAAACIAGCNNNNIGYSQSTRNTLYTEAKKLGYDLSKVATKCNTDCSAFMTVCAIAGGANINYGSNAPTTGTMRDSFTASGYYTALTDSMYTTKTDYLKTGDILVSASKGHTVMVLEDGIEATSPEIPDIPNTPEELCFYSIVSKTSNITDNSCAIEISVVDQLSTAEPTDKFYHYYIEYKKLSDTTYKRASISNKKVTLSNLTEDTCYIYRINIDNSVYSAYKTFNTTKTETHTNKITNIEANGHVCAIYTKVGTNYLPVTVHINDKR